VPQTTSRSRQPGCPAALLHCCTAALLHRCTAALESLTLSLSTLTLNFNYQHPRRSFARGVRAATLVTCCIYVTIAAVLACTVERRVLQQNLQIMETIVDQGSM
jgi:hypothetical protein